MMGSETSEEFEDRMNGLLPKNRSTKLGEEIRKLCELLGIPYDTHERHPSHADCAWDGKVMHFHQHNGNKIYDRSILHDIGHWLTAEPEFRQYMGFGMGATPGFRPSEQPEQPSGSKASETAADAISVLLHWSHDREAAIAHAHAHNWEWCGVPPRLFENLILEIKKHESGREAARLLFAAGIRSLGTAPFVVRTLDLIEEVRDVTDTRREREKSELEEELKGSVWGDLQTESSSAVDERERERERTEESSRSRTSEDEE